MVFDRQPRNRSKIEPQPAIADPALSGTFPSQDQWFSAFEARRNKLEDGPRSTSGLCLFRDPQLGFWVLGRSSETLSVGGKGEGFVALRRDGFPTIDDSLLVSADCFSHIRMQGKSWSEVIEAELPLLRALVDDLIDAAKHAGIEGFFSIRSSGIEDSPYHTASGLYRTEFAHTDLSKDKLAELFLAVLYSAHSEDARAFNLRNNIFASGMGLLLEQVDGADCAFDGSLAGARSEYAAVVDTSDPRFVQIALTTGLCTSVVRGDSSVVCRADRLTREFSFEGFARTCDSLQLIGDRVVLRSDSARFNAADISDDLLGQLELVVDDALTMETKLQAAGYDNFAVNLELCLASPLRGGRLDLRYLQRKPVRSLVSDFPLSIDSSPRVILAESRSVIGQVITSSDKIFRFLGSDSRLLREELDSSSQKVIDGLAEFNESHPSGYFLVVDFERSGGLAARLRLFHQNVQYRHYYNACGIILRDLTPQGHSDFELLAHFAHFFRSEGTPVIALRGPGPTRFSGTIKPEDDEQGIFAELLDAAKPGLQLTDGRKISLAVDQVAGKGILSISKAAS